METPDFFLISHPNTHCSFSRKGATTGSREQSYHFSVNGGASCHHPTSSGFGHRHQQTQMNAAVSGVLFWQKQRQTDITKEPPAVGLLLGYHFN